MMNGYWAMFTKELYHYFATPIAYALIAVFWGVSGYFFSFNLFFTKVAGMATSFHNMSILLLLIMPFLTMRLFAEENRSGTIELLLTLPLSESGIVLAKFTAALVILLVMLFGSTTALVPLTLYGNPDYGPMLGGYLGILLLGSTFIAIGLFISYLTSNQVVAAVVTSCVLIIMWFLDYVATFQSAYSLTATLRHLSFSIHYTYFIQGVLRSDSIVLFGSIIVVFLICTVQALRMRRI